MSIYRPAAATKVTKSNCSNSLTSDGILTTFYRSCLDIFSKKVGYTPEYCIVLYIISSPVIKVVSCHLHTLNLEFIGAWYTIFLKILYQLFIPILEMKFITYRTFILALTLSEHRLTSWTTYHTWSW